MSALPIPLTVISSTSNQYLWGQIGIGNNVLTQQPKNPGYWILVLDRHTLNVVFNQFQEAPNVAPNLGNYNSTDYILVLGTIGVGLNNQPQGEFFTFLDLNGGGRELRRVNQVATQFNCGSLGTFGYALVGILGNQDMPGFEGSQITAGIDLAPILTVQLLPNDINGTTFYTPVSLNDA